MPRDSNNQSDGDQVEQIVSLGFWQKILYLFIVPLLFTLLLTLILGSSLGIFNFTPQLQRTQTWFHNLPLIGAWIPAPAELGEDIESPWEQIRKEIEEQWNGIEQEKAILAQRAEDLDSRERSLAEASSLFNQIQAQRNSREQLINGLVQTIETMKPESAAEVFNALVDEDVEAAVEIMINLDEGKAAKIYNLMDPTRVSAILRRIRR